MKNFWNDLSIKGPIVALAPMDGYTDSAYRQVVKSINPDVICFSEFYSADGIVRSKTLAKSVLPHDVSEKPLIIQIFGKDPQMFREAAKIIEGYGISGIDVNMGCPAKKVVQSGHGSSLMINVDTAFRIIEEMSAAVSIPISVKTRLGFNDTQNLISFAKGLENAGANLLTVHGRTYKQAFTGEADWSMIYELKRHLRIPIIGNGDIQSYENGMEKIRFNGDDNLENSLDGFMIGRASFGNPWCFSPGSQGIPLDERLRIMKMHAKLLIGLKGRKGALESRKHLVQYLHAFPGVKHYRSELVKVESIDDVISILDEILNDARGRGEV